jgi:hypothetical protein
MNYEPIDLPEWLQWILEDKEEQAPPEESSLLGFI